MRNLWKVLLVILAVSCFAVALSYPIRYRMADQRTVEVQEQLIAMRDAAMESAQNLTENPEPRLEAAEMDVSSGTSRDAAIVAEMPGDDASAPDIHLTKAGSEAILKDEAESVEALEESGIAVPRPSEAPRGAEAEAAPDETQPVPQETAAPTLEPKPTVDRFYREGAYAYPSLEKRTLDVDSILPQYARIYALNSDMVGWITIPGTVIDYAVVQNRENSEFYLDHDFFGKENNNGQIFLDPLCDPYTPSYNLVISGHNMRSDQMFGTLDEYRDKRYWEEHKFVRFDTLMDPGEYVVFAAFYSADYDVDETGFRYNTDIQYRIDAEQWIQEVKKNQLYETEIDVEFGDQFLTLTTCNKLRRKDGRFVVVCRKIREGEVLT